MPKNKDRKRLVRSRMQKTGESYTTARRHVLATTSRQDARSTPIVTTDPADLAGMRDEAVRAKTGRTWREWCALLDAEGGPQETHTEIARALRTRHGLSAWWAQTVTGGYERIRGRRRQNERPSGFGTSRSRTFALPIQRVRSALPANARRQWAGDEPSTARRSSNRDVVRFRLGDGSFVDISLLPRGPAKTTVVIHHSRLPQAADVARRRAHWGERLAALARWLAAERQA